MQIRNLVLDIFLDAQFTMILGNFLIKYSDDLKRKRAWA